MKTNKELFHFSFSDKKIINEFLEDFSLSFNDLLNEFFKNSPSLSKENKKANTEKLLKYIFKKRYPIYSSFLENAKKIKDFLKEKNTDFSFDDTFESLEFEIKIKFSTPEEFERKISFLTENKEKLKKYIDEITIK